MRSLPSVDIASGDCSIDGYEPFVNLKEPQILYSSDVISQRARFTVVHELGAAADNDIYRFGLGGAEAMFCDTASVDDRLAVAVMSTRRSDGGLSILEPVEPIWKTREEFCPWCNDERDVGWCDNCSGRECRTCGRCGCAIFIKNRVCPQCQLEGPFRPGASTCRDCEAAGPAPTP